MEWCSFCFSWIYTECVSIDCFCSAIHFFEDRRRDSKALERLSSVCGKLHDTALWCSSQTRDSPSSSCRTEVFFFIYSPRFNVCCLYWEQSDVATPLRMPVVAFLNLKNTGKKCSLSISVGISTSGLAVAAEGLIPNRQRKKQTVWVLVCKTNFQCVAHRLSLIAVNK